MKFQSVILLTSLAGICGLTAACTGLNGHTLTAIILSGGAAILCAVLAVMLYRQVIRPINRINNGLCLLQEQDFSSRLAPIGQREADHIIGMFNRMMATLKEERLKVREQNQLLDLLLEVSPMGVMLLGPSDRITHYNNAAATYLGYDKGKMPEGLELNRLESRLGLVIAELKPNETITTRLDDSMIFRCSRLSFMDKGYAHPYILIEALTEEVMQAERKSYEKVIRLIAHEVNNSMAGISSMLDTITMYAEEEGRDESETEALRACAQRCKSLSRFITSYSDVVKIPEITPVPTELNIFVHKMDVVLESICAHYGARIMIQNNFEEIFVNIDPVLIEQVLINIVKNAAESASANEGTVTVLTKSNPASIIVLDSGPGISPEVSSRLFSPFFSTKPQGQGLGLLFVRDVLRKHGCRFSLRTDPDGMTRFTIIFPD